MRRRAYFRQRALARKNVLGLLATALVLLVHLGVGATARAQGPSADPVDAKQVASNADEAREAAEAVFEAMGPRDRVGQLLLVAFLGNDVGPDSDIANLITEHRVGGVVLQANSGNLSNDPDVGSDEVLALVTTLQSHATGDNGVGVPLWVAVDHEGDGPPRTHLREGFSAVPSAMAIGATWDPDSARGVGEIVGEELAAVGVNLLLGPVLDVLAEPRTTQRGDIGIRSFGGDPFWVGRMGTAYIEGVHLGSRGRVATVAKHFPGHGGSDRLPDTEVATVSKSLQDLERIELPPFMAVTHGPPGSGPGVTDGLMTSHIRYRGFQGNIRDTTPPISLDGAALDSVIDLGPDSLRAWRAGGGLIVADSLGVRAIRRYDDPSETSFNHRDIARDALMAGNDVLILAEFAAKPAWSLQRANIQDTIAYFEEEYRRDPEFRRRVDDAAHRVLLRKASLYPEGWSADAVAPPADLTAGGETAAGVARQVARNAVTVLRGGGGEMPRREDRIVVVTDSAGTLACPKDTCGLGRDAEARLLSAGPTLVEGFLIDKFGPGGSHQIRPENVTSINTCQLEAVLQPDFRPAQGETEVSAEAADTAPAEAAGEATEVPDASGDTAEPTRWTPLSCADGLDRTAVLETLNRADWIIFAYTDLNPIAVPHAEVVENFLQLAGGLVRARTVNLAAMSLGVPYGFEATDFNKLDVFIAAYSKIPVSIEAALDTLFGDLEAEGILPVDVEGANYDLATALEPAPDHPLPLTLVEPEDPTRVVLPAHFVAEVGPVNDHNDHVVPDGTVVEIVVENMAGESVARAAEGTTVNGVARITGAVPEGGRVRLRARSGAATSAEPLTVSFPSPTEVPTRRPTEVVTAAPEPPPEPQAAAASLLMPDLLMCLAAIVLASAGWVAQPGWRRRLPEDRLRGGLVLVAGGLAAYVAYGLGLAAAWTERLTTRPPHIDAAVVGFVGALVGVVGLRLVRWLTSQGTWPGRPGTRREPSQ